MTTLQLNSIEDALKLCQNRLRRQRRLVFVYFDVSPMFYMINVFDKAVGTEHFDACFSSYLPVSLQRLSGLGMAAIAGLIHIASRIDLTVAPRIYELCFVGATGALNARGLGTQPL